MTVGSSMAFLLDTVCIDSSFIETKKAENTPRIMATKKEKAKRSMHV